MFSAVAKRGSRCFSSRYSAPDRCIYPSAARRRDRRAGSGPSKAPARRGQCWATVAWDQAIRIAISTGLPTSVTSGIVSALPRATTAISMASRTNATSPALRRSTLTLTACRTNAFFTTMAASAEIGAVRGTGLATKSPTTWTSSMMRV